MGRLQNRVIEIIEAENIHWYGTVDPETLVSESNIQKLYRIEADNFRFIEHILYAHYPKYTNYELGLYYRKDDVEKAIRIFHLIKYHEGGFHCEDLIKKLDPNLKVKQSVKRLAKNWDVKFGPHAPNRIPEIE